MRQWPQSFKRPAIDPRPAKILDHGGRQTVGDYSDDAVIRIYARENATQRGNTGAALAGSIAAAFKRLTYLDLSPSDGENGSSAVDFTSRRPHTRHDQGIGQDRILAELKGVPRINDNNTPTGSKVELRLDRARPPRFPLPPPCRRRTL
jgi:hypothetical protein